FGEKYIPSAPNLYKTKSKGAQEAHEAIRPTSIKRAPADVKKHLSKEQYLLYDLIWKRFAASQMNPAVFDVASVDLKAGEYEFRALGRTMLFDGWMKVYDVSDEKYAELPPMEAGDACALVSPPAAEKHSSAPPPRYNEASLIKTLEEYGIGRPSTYASIIFTIMQRRYVELNDRRFTPTQTGALVTEFLKKHFSDIVDLDFTAAAEEDLDEIAEGKKPWKDIIEDFYAKFSEQIKKADVTVLTDEKCPDCGAPLAERASRYGRFLACSAFPKCRYIKKEKPAPKPPPVQTGENCPDCGAPLVERTGRFGKFAACLAFPKCRYIKKENKPYGKFRRFARKHSGAASGGGQSPDALVEPSDGGQ
ncbi:MAG: DNA topoisomerase, partial [Endomicrobiia bacterium]|nr:DNA topoisomerase [Endomicrobiia bacterium]